MNKLEEYYNEILRKIEKLVTNKKVDEAIFILEDELSAPYIPGDIFDKLQEVLNDLVADKRYFSNLINYEKLNKQQLSNAVFKKNGLDLFALQNFFDRFASKMDQYDFSLMENFFVDINNNNEEKVLLFECLVHHKITNSFLFANGNLNETILCNTNEIKLFEEIDLYANTKKLIDDLTFKEPSVNKIALNILDMVYKYHFPITPNIDFRELTKSIIDNVLYSLKGTVIQSNVLNNLVQKIISKFTK